MREQPGSEQCQITDQIQHLVPSKFVRIQERRRKFAITNDNRIFTLFTTLDEAELAQSFHIFGTDECACWRYDSGIAIRRDDLIVVLCQAFLAVDIGAAKINAS